MPQASTFFHLGLCTQQSSLWQSLEAAEILIADLNYSDSPVRGLGQ